MSNPKVNCVILADRHHGLTEGVRHLLSSAFDAVVMVADENSLFESAERLRPDVVVVDLSFVRSGDLQWLARLRTRCPGTKVIVVSVHDEPTVRDTVLSGGADAFVVKRMLATELLATIDLLQRERPPVSDDSLRARTS